MDEIKTYRPINILLVEDNPGDVRLTIEALKKCKIHNNLSIAGDGVQALEFLHKQGQHAGAARPDLVILDLNLPKKDGREVLKEIKEDPNLKTIPVAVMTVSSAEEDVIKSYQLHANCYIRKPISMDQFITVVNSINDFWFTIVTLPPNA